MPTPWPAHCVNWTSTPPWTPASAKPISSTTPTLPRSRTLTPGTFVYQGCTVYFGGPSTLFHSGTSDASGVAVHPAPVPNKLSLEGRQVSFQAIGRDPGNGPLFSSFELSDGLLVRLGNAQPNCP